MTGRVPAVVAVLFVVGGAALAKGLRTADIKSEGTTVVGTSQMGDAIIAEIGNLAKS